MHKKIRNNLRAIKLSTTVGLLKVRYWFLATGGLLGLTKKEVVEESERKQREFRWYAAGGDRTLRLNYPLTPDSVVIDAGGYEGDWSDAIWKKYQPTIYVFEPIQEFADMMRKRFAGNQKITIYTKGLSSTTGQENIYLSKSGTSLFKKAAQERMVEMISARDFFSQESIQEVDLMKINIEGSEYPLLEHIIQTGLVQKIKDIQVQFHNFVPNATERRRNIRKQLRATHTLVYDFPFVWESWRRKDTRE